MPILYRALGSTPSMQKRKRKGEVEEIEKRRTLNAAGGTGRGRT